MYLYHFTNIDSYRYICQDGYIKLSPSNLKQPHRATACYKEYPDGRGVYYWDKWSDYKPVVWLTTLDKLDVPSTDDPDDLNETGLYRRKMGVRLTIEYDPTKHMKWEHFANINHMDWNWRKAFTTGYDHDTWYVARQPIPISDIIETTFYPEYDERITEIVESLKQQTKD